MSTQATTKGDCINCPYFDAYQNYCNHYKMWWIGNGYEPTCNNPELKPRNNENQNHISENSKK